MKSIKHYILEALKINSKSKVLKSKEDIKDLDVYYVGFDSFVNNFIKYVDKTRLPWYNRYGVLYPQGGFSL